MYYRWSNYPPFNSEYIVGCTIDGVGYGTLVSVKNDAELLTDFRLLQNYPNPFNPSTTIKFSIPIVGAEHVQPLHVVLKVFDLLGRVVATLVNEEKASGNYEVKFSVETRCGESLPSGVYFYQLIAGGNVITKKFILMK